MQGQIGRWGNSLALRIPAAIARQTALHDGRSVDVSVDRGRIIITPVDRAPRYDLDDLLAGVTEENRHAETDAGPAVGDDLA